MINVHLIASKSNVLEDTETLRDIMGAVRDQGHHVVSDWVESAYDDRVNRSNASADWQGIYRKNLEDIAKADVVIAETTYNSLGVGYQTAIALQQKKPTLLLRREDAESDAFATGIADSWAKQVKYTKETLGDEIRKFLDENDIKTKDMRFNFFIDRSIYNYLRWAAHKSGKTKAEILRTLIKNEIGKKGY